MPQGAGMTTRCEMCLDPHKRIASVRIAGKVVCWVHYNEIRTSGAQGQVLRVTEPTAPTEPVASSGSQRRPRLNLERARAMIADWRASGLGRAAFAEQQDICLKTFDRWRSRVEGAGRKSDSGLARVAIEPSDREARSALCVIPGTPPQVLLPPDWDSACLRRVLEACRC